jgi:hypothetical protein
MQLDMAQVAAGAAGMHPARLIRRVTQGLGVAQGSVSQVPLLLSMEQILQSLLAAAAQAPLQVTTTVATVQGGV